MGLSPSLLRRFGRTTWIPAGLRYRALRRLWPPGTPHRFEVDYVGGRFAGDLASMIEWQVHFFGAYEPAVLAFLRDSLMALGRGDGVAADIGANVGQHSIVMSRHAAHVHAFEPWPTALESLRRNLALNALDNVTVHPFGIGLEDGTLDYYPPRGDNLGGGTFVKGTNNLHAPGGRLPVRKADAVFGGLDRLDVVKIDVEGAEVDVLLGLSETLKRLRPVLVVEALDVTRERLAKANSDSLAFLAAPDWSWHRIVESGDRYSLSPDAFARNGMMVAIPGARLAQVPRSGRL